MKQEAEEKKAIWYYPGYKTGKNSINSSGNATRLQTTARHVRRASLPFELLIAVRPAKKEYLEKKNQKGDPRKSDSRSNEQSSAIQ